MMFGEVDPGTGPTISPVVTRSCWRCEILPRGQAARRFLVRSTRGGPGHRRPGGVGPHRIVAGDLRCRPRRFRRNHRERSFGARRPTPADAPHGRRPDTRKPPGSGTGAQSEHAGEHLSGQPGAVVVARHHLAGPAAGRRRSQISTSCTLPCPTRRPPSPHSAAATSRKWSSASG